MDQVANTQLAACVSGLIWLTLDSIHTQKVSLVCPSQSLVFLSCVSPFHLALSFSHLCQSQCFNGIVAGLAGITPAAGFINPQWALLVAAILGFASFYGRMLFMKMGIDDAQEVCIIHGFTGLIGMDGKGLYLIVFYPFCYGFCYDFCPCGVYFFCCCLSFALVCLCCFVLFVCLFVCLFVLSFLFASHCLGSLANGFFALKSICPTGQDGWIAGHPVQIAYQLLGTMDAFASSFL
jgi:ammonia channel protein AmtB